MTSSDGAQRSVLERFGITRLVIRVTLMAPMGEQPDDRQPSAEANAAWGVISLLFAGMLFWGGAGWLLDHALGTKAFVPIGLLLGIAGSLYLVIKRYGQE
jgi:ATP synthase protein I